MAYIFGDFHEIFQVCGQLCVLLTFKFYLDSFKVFWTYGGLNLFRCIQLLEGLVCKITLYVFGHCTLSHHSHLIILHLDVGVTFNDMFPCD